MNYANIKYADTADGPGTRVSLFVSGCTNHCKGCFQPETWDFNYGTPYTKEVENGLIEALQSPFIQGLTLLGGDPCEPCNQRALLSLVKRVKETYPNKNIWCYTGFTYELLKTEGSHPRCSITDEFLSCIDVLVDGPFILEQKQLGLLYRGSKNQRLLDIRNGQMKPLEIDEFGMIKST